MPQLTFTLIQTNLHWEDKQANLAMLEQKIRQVKGKTEIVVLPEMFSTGFSMKPEILAETMDGETVAWMKRLSAEQKIIITGSLIIKDGEKYYNRLIWMQPNGQYGCYDKRHLFAYGKEDEHYTAGHKRLAASVKGWKINLQVCYDLRFAVWARQAPPTTEAGQGGLYDVLLYVANWPERRINAWRTLLQARAIENQCYVIGVNRVGNDGNNIYHSGNSMAINALGEILWEKAHEEEVFTITLDKELLDETRARFPFWKDADKYFITHE